MNNKTAVVLILGFSSAVHAAVVCPPPSPGREPLCIKTGTVYTPKKGEMIAVSEVFMEDNSTLRLDPLEMETWDIKIGDFYLGTNTLIDLSGRDDSSKPGPSQNAQPQLNPCASGFDGWTGKPGAAGQHSAKAVFTVTGKLVSGSTYVIRKGGGGGEGGDGGAGSQGGNGAIQCGCNGAPGGYGGVGGRGGDGGDAKMVQIRFKQLTSGLTKVNLEDLTVAPPPGINDSPTSKGGKGGNPGNGGAGGTGGGKCGWGGVGTHRPRAGNQGEGTDGKTESLLLIPY